MMGGGNGRPRKGPREKGGRRFGDHSIYSKPKKQETA